MFSFITDLGVWVLNFVVGVAKDFVVFLLVFGIALSLGILIF